MIAFTATFITVSAVILYFLAHDLGGGGSEPNEPDVGVPPQPKPPQRGPGIDRTLVDEAEQRATEAVGNRWLQPLSEESDHSQPYCYV